MEVTKTLLGIINNNFLALFSTFFSFAVLVLTVLQVLIKTRKIEMDKDLLQIIYEINKVNMDLINKSWKLISMPIKKNFDLFTTTASVVLNTKKSLKIKVKPTEKKEKEKAVIISTLFLSQKLKNIYKSYIALVIANVIALLLPFIPTITSILTIVLTILVFLYQQALSYRVKNGLFGSNAYEAQELLEFLVKNQDKIDSNGNGFFNEENLKEIALDMSKLIGKMEASR